MTPDQIEILREICAKLATERDPAKFNKLAQELGVWLKMSLAQQHAQSQATQA